MSTKQSTETKRSRGAPKKKVTKVRQNISITPAVLKMAQKLAFADGLSLSSWVEQLVRTKLGGES